MTPRRAATWLGGSTLLAAWFAAAAAPTLDPGPAVESPRPASSEPDRRVLALAAETQRLKERLSIVATPRPVTRNPFQFGPKPPRVAPITREPVAPPPVAAPAPPPVTLLGLAEDTRGAHAGRTAILSLAGDLLLVREGEPVGGRYRVIRISADALELEDTTESRTIRIVLP